MTSTCYNGGSEYLQVFRSSNIEIKNLLQDVVQQLKKQNKKAEKMLKHLESQTAKVGEVFQHLKGQNDHLGDVLRNLDTQDRHMDRVLQRLRNLNDSDYDFNEDATREFNRNLHYGMMNPMRERTGRRGSLVQFRDLDKSIGQVFRNFKSQESSYDWDDYDLEEDVDDENDFYDYRRAGSYSGVHSVSNYKDEDKIFDFSENRRKSHEDFLSFIGNNTRSMRLDNNNEDDNNGNGL